MKKSVLGGIVVALSLSAVLGLLYRTNLRAEPTVAISPPTLEASSPALVTGSNTSTYATAVSHSSASQTMSSTLATVIGSSTTVPVPTTSPPATTSVVALDCGSPGTSTVNAPGVTEVDNPNPTNFEASSEILVKGINMSSLSEVLLCPTAGTTEPEILLGANDITGGINQLNLDVTNQLVSGAIYDVRIVANGMISNIVSSDKLYVAIAAHQNALI